MYILIKEIVQNERLSHSVIEGIVEDTEVHLGGVVFNGRLENVWHDEHICCNANLQR